MSLYNILFGQNSESNNLLHMIGLTTDKVGRFRDCFVSGDGESILVYTRNGGGNRTHYPQDTGKKEGVDCNCTGCIITYQLPIHPNYIKDYDDDFDCTYATVEFSVPEEFKETCKAMATGEDPQAVSDKFKDAIEKIKEGKDPEMEKKAKTIMQPIIDALEQPSKDGKPKIIKL